MTNTQKKFCDEYLIDLNATRAYKTAYLNCKSDLTARTNSSRLLTNANIQNYIQKKMEDREKRTKITQDMVIQELAKIAFLDISKLYDKNGNLKNIQNIDKNTVKAISSLETLEEYGGYGENRKKIGDTQKVKMLDKTKALELLGRHLGIFNDKINANINGKVSIEEYLKKVEGDEY